MVSGHHSLWTSLAKNAQKTKSRNFLLYKKMQITQVKNDLESWCLAKLWRIISSTIFWLFENFWKFYISVQNFTKFLRGQILFTKSNLYILGLSGNTYAPGKGTGCLKTNESLLEGGVVKDPEFFEFPKLPTLICFVIY